MQIETNVTRGENPLVSFIVPVYNVPEHLLRLCIESIIRLPLKESEREIFVVDDGSDIPPTSVLSGFVNQITYIRQSNGGLSVARNTGIDHASANYLQFVDADDELIPGSYAHCLEILRVEAPDVVMFGLTHSAEPTYPKDFHDTAFESGTALMLQQNLRGSACAYIFKKSLTEELRFTPGIYHEDEEFTPLLLLKARKIVVTDTKAYFYRKREDSITTRTDKKTTLRRINDKKNIILKHNDLSKTLDNPQKSALERRVAQLTMDYLYEIMKKTKDTSFLETQVADLRREGLFPLPDRRYTWKYNWFRRMTNTKLGRRLLINLLN